eukprot:5903414-Alexandrium_andersonii.AAC.1
MPARVEHRRLSGQIECNGEPQRPAHAPRNACPWLSPLCRHNCSKHALRVVAYASGCEGAKRVRSSGS